MTLDDQLHELRFNILRDRSDIIAGDTDSLWSDETLIRYIGDAERRFARQTLILRDSTTPEITQVRLRKHVRTYALHPSVLSVLSGRYEGVDYDLQRSGHAMLVRPPSNSYLSFDPILDYKIRPGAPLAYYTDETLVFGRANRVSFSVYPAPGEHEDGKFCYLRTIRSTTTCYDKDHLTAESELPEDYQLDVLEWAAYRAQRTFDGDAGAPTSADQHKAAFDESVVNAIKEMKNKTFANLGYQYGMNGFQWVR